MSSESAKATARESLSNIGVSLVSAESRMNAILELEENTTSLTGRAECGWHAQTPTPTNPLSPTQP